MEHGAASFDWDDGNRRKCQKHGLSIAEIEHVLAHGETFIVPDLKNLRMSLASSPSAGVPVEDTSSLSSRRGEETTGRFGGRSARATCTGRRSLDMKKKFPVLKTDEEAEAFLEQDLTDYLHAGNFKSAQWMRFEFKPKQKSLNLRISEELLDAVRKNAKREGIPYQRYIRQALERAVMERKR
jgi:predicted DNA binding CopG/RHH family protein